MTEKIVIPKDGVGEFPLEDIVTDEAGKVEAAPQQKEDVPPVSFFKLLRYFLYVHQPWNTAMP